MNILKTLRYTTARILVGVAATLLVTTGLMPVAAHAATNFVPQAQITFTFDDSLASSYTQAAPTLAKYGLSGTDYAITGCVGMTTVPNTCHANEYTPYMTWAQVQALQNSYGWEIGSHTVDHYCLASSALEDPSDCQTSPMTTAQVDAELGGSKAALAAHGINATDFAPPYGDYNAAVLREIAKYYGSMRNFRNDTNNVNTWPYNDYYLWDVPVQETATTVAMVEAKINAAIANHQWLILTFHDIKVKPSHNPDNYEWGTGELGTVAAYTQAKQTAGLIRQVNINQGLTTSSTNMLPNGNFNDGIADGWNTDDPAHITADAGTNGSYPDATNSVKLVSSGTPVNGHLFSPIVNVNSNTTYAFKNFLSVQATGVGLVSLYIDEYDLNGNWISGQYKGGESSTWVDSMNFGYTPTSIGVAKIRFQVTVAGTGMTAYFANAQMWPVTTTSPPVQTNLMVNGAFDDGIADGWHTDSPSTITADALNNGSPSNPVNSVKAVSSSTNTHLFSPLITVSPTNTYSLETYVNVKTLTSGEVGFYIDEYDASGNWISGQYKTGARVVGSGYIAFSYTPSPANVAKASLQVIIVGNSGITAYVDDVRWYQN